jgi:predicted enzyme related to lactoylglutathione lyase
MSLKLNPGAHRAAQTAPQVWCAIALSMLYSTALRAASFELPPLNSPASLEHHVGKVVWADLVTPDLAAAERFYSGLFGWTFQTIHAGDSDYAVALLDGRPVGGLFQKAIPASEHRQSAWLTFIAVRDVDATKRAVFAILASSSGDSPDFLAAPGEWIWSSLLSKDPGAEAGFYQEVFGYDAFDMASDDGMEHVILSSDNFARASTNALPADSMHRRPHWMNFVRVDSATAMASKVVALGGRVLVEPHADRHGGMIAVVADPAGAPFGLMEWTDNDTKVEPK